jgi:hypothetical protein
MIKLEKGQTLTDEDVKRKLDEELSARYGEGIA